MWKKSIKERKGQGDAVLFPTKEHVFECERGGITAIVAVNQEQREQLADQIQQFAMDREDDTEFLFVPDRGIYRGGYKTFLRYAKAMAAAEPGVDLDYFQSKMEAWDIGQVMKNFFEEASRLFVIILALSRQSQVLIFDDMMNNISPKWKTKIHEELMEWQQRDNHTIVFLSHKKEESEELADDIYFWEEEVQHEKVL